MLGLNSESGQNRTYLNKNFGDQVLYKMETGTVPQARTAPPKETVPELNGER